MSDEREDRASEREPRSSEPSIAAPRLDVSGRRGRALFFAGLISYLIWETAVLALQLAYDSPFVSRSVARVLPGLGLFFFAWRGRPWATVLLTLIFVVVMLAGWATAASGEYGLEVGALIAIATTWFGAWGIALQALPALRRYLAFQRDND